MPLRGRACHVGEFCFRASFFLGKVREDGHWHDSVASMIAVEQHSTIGAKRKSQNRDRSLDSP